MNPNQFNPQDFWENTIWQKNPNTPAALGIGGTIGGLGGAGLGLLFNKLMGANHPIAAPLLGGVLGLGTGLGVGSYIEPLYPNIKNYDSIVQSLPEKDLKTFYSWYGQNMHENPNIF